jgi:hypothetical protein
MKIGTSQKNPIKKKETNENFKKSMFTKIIVGIYI